MTNHRSVLEKYVITKISCCLISLLFLSVLATFAHADSPATVEHWRAIELDFTSNQTYQNPYKDIDLDTTFTGPDGQKITRPAFWYKDNIWKVRFAPTSTGTWTWTSTCSNAKDDGLHNRTGSVSSVAYNGNLPIYKHGFIGISQNHRYFTHADGTPFFWLGDTHWQMPNMERIDACNHPEHHGGACPYGGQFQHVVADRLAKKFSVYQTYVAIASHKYEQWWEQRWTRIKPERFNREFDFEMKYLADKGFVIALGLDHYAGAKIFPLKDMKRMARYIVARYGAYPVVWITGQEINCPDSDIDYWKAVAAEVGRLDGYHHPNSGHQWVLPADKRPLGNEPWHNWFALQGGHGGNAPQTKNYYKSYWDFRPTKPFLEIEADYEQVECGGKADDTGARQQAYKSFLCGSYGYTYGAAGIWALRWDRDVPIWKDFNTEAWFDGLNLPGSRQMTRFKDFCTKLEWWKLTPRWNDSQWGEWAKPEEAVISTDGNNTYVVYFYNHDKATGILKNLDPKSPYTASWFNPRNGEYIKIKDPKDPLSPENNQWTIPEKPDTQDWVLLVQNLFIDPMPIILLPPPRNSSVPRKHVMLYLNYGLIVDNEDKKPSYYLFSHNSKRIYKTHDVANFLRELNKIPEKSMIDMINKCTASFYEDGRGVRGGGYEYGVNIKKEYAQIMKLLQRKKCVFVRSLDQDVRHASFCYCETGFQILEDKQSGSSATVDGRNTTHSE